MKIEKTEIEGCLFIEMDDNPDGRGFFRELYHEDRYIHEVGMFHVKQVNWSFSKKNVVRGIHITPFAKLVACVQGLIFDVCVDLRPESPTYLKTMCFLLNPFTPRQVVIPANCGHGFMALDDNTAVVYMQTAQYDSRMERSIRWDDPTIGVLWPKADGGYNISDKDLAAPNLKEK